MTVAILSPSLHAETSPAQYIDKLDKLENRTKRSKSTSSDALSRLAREPIFFQESWDTLQDHILELGKQLVEENGFIAQPIAEGEILSLKSKDGLHIVILPRDVHSITPSSPFMITDPSKFAWTPQTEGAPVSTLIKPHHPIHFDHTSLQIPAIREIVYCLQTFFPGRVIPSTSPRSEKGEISPGEVGRGEEGVVEDEMDSVKRGFPPVKWMSRNEDLIRESMGCSWFRHLMDATVAGNRY